MKIKAPETEAEFRSMWQLNHAVFADELKQHPHHDDQLLIDKFHHKNIYRIALDRRDTVIGMLSAHWQEPFSAVQRFGDALAAQLPPGRTAEIRLFAVRPDHRMLPVSIRLAVSVFRALAKQGCERVVISGVAARRGLYEHSGFVTMGEPVQDGEAWFYPMVADLPRIVREHPAFRRYADE